MSHLRFVNAFVPQTAVDIYLNATDAQSLIPGIQFGEATCYVKVNANQTYNLLVTEAGNKSVVIATAVIRPLKNRDYTLILQGAVPNVEIRAYNDENRCCKNQKVSLRFIHADIRSSLDLFNLLADEYTIFKNVAYSTSGTPPYIPAKPCHFSFSVTNGAGVVVPSFDITFKKNHIYTFIAIDDPVNDSVTILPIANKCHK